MPNDRDRDGHAFRMSRRKMLKGVAAVLGAMALPAKDAPASVWETFFQKNFREMSPEELKAVVARLEKEYGAKYGKQVRVGVNPPLEGVRFAYGLDLSRCIGCRRCVYACVGENNQSRNPQIQWIRVLQLNKERGVDLEDAEPYYNPARVPEPGHFYMPVQCQQCENPPCVKVCPVQATWKERDGITVVD